MLTKRVSFNYCRYIEGCYNLKSSIIAMPVVSAENMTHFGWNKFVREFEGLTCPKLPHIFACMEGYICFSLMVIVISLSKMAVTRCRLASSLCLQNRTKLRSQGVIYSRHRCFSSIPKAPQMTFW